jgi:hypothetical protein
MRSTVTLSAIHEARAAMYTAQDDLVAIDRLRAKIRPRGDTPVPGLDVEWSDIDAALEVLQDEAIDAYRVAEAKLWDMGVTP